MPNFIFTLEKYRGTNSRHTCPNCNARREFTRYIDASGNYLAADVGKCNRESKCGYHKKPKEYFADNPNLRKFVDVRFKKGNKLQQVATQKKEKYGQVWTEKKKDIEKIEPIKKAEISFDSIPFDYFKKTLENFQQNNFVKFLSDLFPDDLEAVRNTLQRYYIGTHLDGLTVYWQIDGRGRIRTGKIMRYDAANGKRKAVRSWMQDGEMRELKTDWMHGKIKKGFKLKQCFFGEHLLLKEPGKIVSLVEAEKTAVIASICFPKMIWLAVGAKGYLQAEKFQVLSGRRILLFPDADAYSNWKEKALQAQRNGFDVRVSNLIELNALNAEKSNGFDLADYLIDEQRNVNKHNDFAKFYNEKIKQIQTSESSEKQFETILEEQKSILMIDGELPESEAENHITQAENVRNIVLSL